MKATRRQIYFEEQESTERFSMGVGGTCSAHWQVRCLLHQWHSYEQTIYVVDLYSWDRRKRPTEERHDQQMLGCDTDAAAQRASMRLFGQRVQALAGTTGGEPRSNWICRTCGRGMTYHCGTDLPGSWHCHHCEEAATTFVSVDVEPEVQNLCALCGGPMSSRAETFRTTRWWCDACQKRGAP